MAPRLLPFMTKHISGLQSPSFLSRSQGAASQVSQAVVNFHNFEFCTSTWQVWLLSPFSGNLEDKEHQRPFDLSTSEFQVSKIAILRCCNDRQPAKRFQTNDCFVRLTNLGLEAGTGVLGEKGRPSSKSFQSHSLCLVSHINIVDLQTLHLCNVFVFSKESSNLKPNREALILAL